MKCVCPTMSGIDLYTLDAFHLLGRAYWVGCEFIAFTTYNIFTDFNSILLNNGVMHMLPYPINNGEE